MSKQKREKPYQFKVHVLPEGEYLPLPAFITLERLKPMEKNGLRDKLNAWFSRKIKD